MTVNLAKSHQYNRPAMPWMDMIQNEMLAVEDFLRVAINSAVPTAFELSQHLLTAGGKRLRPAMVILSAKACGHYDPNRAAAIAGCCEMIHMATLVHDDVIDRTDSRRGRATVNAFWGNKVSVLSGDYLLSKAFAVLCNDGDLRILHEISHMTIAMSESEVLQAVSEGNLAAWEEHYWDIIRGKTARFLESCCKSGAILAEARDEWVEALGEFGLNIGTAFQVIDDLLDIAGDPIETGKPVGTDIKEGKTTLPILIALRDSDDSTRNKLLSLLNAPSVTAEDVEAICDSVRLCGGVEKTREVARVYVNKGLQALRILPESQARQDLEALASYLVDRTL